MNFYIHKAKGRLSQQFSSIPPEQVEEIIFLIPSSSFDSEFISVIKKNNKDYPENYVTIQKTPYSTCAKR